MRQINFLSAADYAAAIIAQIQTSCGVDGEGSKIFKGVPYGATTSQTGTMSI
jgi:hypothetical protein